jgi:hypothetical protein
MTETEWLALHHLDDGASKRKRRLFACACCRAVWFLLTDEGRLAVEMAERFADGDATADELAAARDAAGLAASVAVEAEIAPWGAAWDAVREATATAAGDVDRTRQAFLLCDIRGNPSRPVSVSADWLTPTVTSLAQAAYDERLLPSGELDLARLSVLADALEEGGASGEILGHLRGPGPHVRGCAVIDVLLGKE